ncbi:MAG: hypothetical protein LC670_09390, partial [Flavobacteriales bacterium]|nr:hypothetical protein [Flavobacteriales bacterium]
MNTYISVLRKLSLFSVAVLLFLPLAAQYGPMGIGNADGSEAPAGTSQPRLLLWLDGSSVTVSNNQNVMVWPDKSGNDHHFVSENTSVAPVFKSTGGPGNRSYVQFNKADNRMYCQNFPMSNDGYSIYFVVRSNDNRYGVFSYGSAADPKELVLYNDNGLRVDMGSSTQNTVINDIDNGDWAYGGILHDIGSFFWNYRKVGESESNSNFGNGETISPTGTAVIGNIQQSLNGGFLPDDALAGDIAEVIVWEGALNRGQSRLMRTYLWTKYGAPFRRNGNNGWDKFRGYAAGSGGKYYEPVGIGRDNGNPNGGQHSEARLKGLVLRVNTGQWTQGRSYTVAGYNGATNSIVTSGVPAGVDNRWSRTWEINGADGNQQVRVAFDFGEGISGGDIPQEAENFVLLYRNGTTGNFTLFPESNIIEKAIVDDEVVFTVQRSNINTNNRYYTIGTTNAGVSSLDGSALRTWYAYQSGNWDDPSTWTLDGSASPTYVNAGGNIPGTGDAVVVGSGRTVTCNLNNRSQTVLKVFGTVDFNTTSGHNMGTISGNGTIRCAGSGGNGNFPAGNLTAFANPNTGGQTVFYGSGFTQTANLELNRVRVEMNSAASQITMAANFTHNGLFEIKTGTFQVNNGANATRSIESFGNVLIETQGRIRVSGTNRTHSWTFHGDLVNEGGDIRFTNRTAQNHGSNDPQRVITRFVDGTKNQRLVANGTSYFSQIVVNKGSNSTYVLTVSAENAGDFGLFGRSAQNMGSSAYFNEGSQDNALALVNGTIEIRENVFIPLHYGGGNYNINETATLWVNGGSAGKGPVLVPGASTGTAIVPYGKILVTDGLLRADCGSGITTRSNGIIQVDGGEVYATQIRTSVFGPANVGGIIINGGLVDVDGTRAGGPANNFYIFSLTYTGNLFRMTGGTLR